MDSPIFLDATLLAFIAGIITELLIVLIILFLLRNRR